jgi:hypothetical protein
MDGTQLAEKGVEQDLVEKDRNNAYFSVEGLDRRNP